MTVYISSYNQINVCEIHQVFIAASFSETVVLRDPIFHKQCSVWSIFLETILGHEFMQKLVNRIILRFQRFSLLKTGANNNGLGMVEKCDPVMGPVGPPELPVSQDPIDQRDPQDL